MKERTSSFSTFHHHHNTISKFVNRCLGRFSYICRCMVFMDLFFMRLKKRGVIGRKLFFPFLLIVLLFSGTNIIAENADLFIDLDDQSRIDTLIHLADASLLNNYDTAIHFAQAAYLLAKKSNHLKSIAASTKIIADAWYYKDELDQSIKYYELSAEARKSYFGETSVPYAESLSDIGYCFYVLGLYDKAENYFRQSMQIAEKNNAMDLRYDNMNNLATLYYHWGEYGKAIDTYHKTLEYDQQQNNLRELSSSYNNIGKVYYVWEKYDQAIEYFTYALELAEQVKDTNRIAIRLGNIGMLYYKLNEYEKAMDYLNQAIELSALQGNRRKVAVRKNELGKILTSQERYTEALEYLYSAYITFREIGALESVSISLIDLGNLSMAMGKPKDAEEYYNDALNNATKTKTLQILMSASMGLSELYEKQGDFERSLEYFKQYSEYNKQIFSLENDKRISAFEVKYETEKKEIENQLLKSENEIKTRNQVYLIIALSGLFLLLLMLTYYLRLRNKNHNQQKKLATLELEKKEREKQHLEDKVFAEKQINRLQKEKHKNELEHKNNQLANSTLSLVNKNEVLTDIKANIKKVTDSGEGIEEIISMINQNVDLNADWKKFRMDFDAAHPGFFDRLHSKYPDLSETHEKLCAYLRINLTSKSIAELLHVSVAAVNKNRQRLRKKLNLEAEADLGEFLKEI